MAEAATTTIETGVQAPDFTVPSVQEDRVISLAEYRGRTPLLLGLFPGLYCPFCRRALKQMATASTELKSRGIESLAVVGTELDNARLYFQYRPTPLTLGADPQLTTHRLYGVPKPGLTPEVMEQIEQVRINPTGELPEPMHPLAAFEALSAIDAREGYVPTATDKRDQELTMSQLKGQFLIDREGVVRWLNIECSREGISGLGKFPTPEELLTAARAVST
jgi:peroxiredoxin